MRRLGRDIRFCVITLCFSAALRAQEKPKDKPDLARVAITRYQDQTGTRNFGYMPDSLTDAIDAALQTRFEYLREEPAKTRTAAQQFLKGSETWTAENAAAFSKVNKTDILIIGKFSFDAATNELVVTTHISLGAKDKFRTLAENRNRVDTTIFRMAERVADDIVAELARVALEQGTDKQKAQAKKDDKIALMKDKSPNWPDVRWTVSGGFSPVLPLASGFAGRRNISPAAFVGAERRIWGPLHIGAEVSAMETHVSTIDIRFIGAAAQAAYRWDISPRWRLGAELGAGYYFGSYKNSQCLANCSASATGTYDNFAVQNPYFMGRLALQFLIFRWLSLGAYGQGMVYYDSPTILPFAGGGLAVAAHF